MSVPVGKLPAQISPLGSQGVSIDTRTITCAAGVMSNIDEFLRPSNKAKVMTNFHQFSRGVFSSGGGGWARDLASGLNGGTNVISSFGTYLDAIGNNFLLVQCGNTLYNYTLGGVFTVTGTVTLADIVTIVFQLQTGQHTFTYNVLASDVSGGVNTLAGHINTAMGLDGTLTGAGVTATTSTNTVTIVLPNYLPDPVPSTSNSGNTALGTETITFVHQGLGSSISGMTGLSTTAIACMRPSAPTSLTTNPFTIFCNGVQEPVKIYNATAGAEPNTVSTLGFGSGVFSTNVQVSGTVTVGANVILTVFSPSLNVSPASVSYTPVVGDTPTLVAVGLANKINTNTTLTSAGFLATSQGTVIVISYPTTATVVFGSQIKTEYIQVGSFTAGTTVKQMNALGSSASYTTVVGDTTTTVAINWTAAINANQTFAASGLSASYINNGAGNTYILLAYPAQVSISFTLSGGTDILYAGIVATDVITGTPTVGDNCNLTFTNASLTGSPVTVAYTQTAADVALGLTNVATNVALGLNANANITGFSVSALGSGNVVLISYANNGLLPVITLGTTTGVIQTLNTTAYTNGSVTLAFTANNSAGTFPGTFDGLTFTKPAFCAPFQSRMAYTGFANTGPSGNAVGQAILISSLGNAEVFKQSVPTAATDAWTIPIPPICGSPTAMRSLKLNTNVSSEVLIVGCSNGMVIISGNDATTYNLQIYSQTWGIPSNRCFAQLDNALLFMATDGFRTYTGQNNNSNLLTDSISLDIYDQFKLIDRNNWQKAHCIHHLDTQEIWFWTPYLVADNGVPQHAFIFQYNTLDGQPIWYNVNNTSCTASIEFNHTFYGGNELGLIQRWYGCSNFDDSISGLNGAANVLPGATIVLSLVGVGNIAQMCSIRQCVIGASNNNQKFLINAAAYESMDNGSTRKQQQQPINFLVQSASVPQTVLGPATPAEWTLNFSAFPQLNSKFLGDYVPQGHGRLWEFSLTCNDTTHNLDFTMMQVTISIGGMRV